MNMNDSVPSGEAASVGQPEAGTGEPAQVSANVDAAGQSSPQPPAAVGAAPVPVPRVPYTGYGLALLVCLAVVSALHWGWYPLFVDTYYHMAVIQGMEQAGGLPGWAFWEMAPGGRVHIYPPTIHVVGYYASLVGVSPVKYVTFLSWVLYPACLAATWLWLRKLFGARVGLIAVILLSGSTAVFWNQTTFTANAFSMTLAPLALLALESEQFLACGVLNLLASAAHPMGLFLPPALVINTLLRRKRWVAGLLAASVPVLLYAPWLAHIWANRAYLPEQRTGGDISLMGIGAGSGLNLGVALTGAAVLGLVWILVRRREALGLLGPVLGFVVVVPMGFGGRLFQFNLHWPLACLGAYGAGMMLDWIELKRPQWQSAIKIVSVSLAFLVMVTWVAVEIPMPKKFGGLGGPGGPAAPARTEPRAQDPQRGPGPEAVKPVRFTVGLSQLVQLFDPESRPMPFGGGAPGGMPGRAGGLPGAPGQGMPAAGPGQLPGQPDPAGVFRGAGGMPGRTGGFPGADPAQGNPMGPGQFPSQPDQAGIPRGPGGMGRNARFPDRTGFQGNRDLARQGGRAGFGGAPGSVNMIRLEGAQEYFDAVTRLVAVGEVISVSDGPASSLVTGATGRWTTGGILRDVRSADSRTRAENCQFLALLATGGVGGRPDSQGGGNSMRTQGFTKVFENAYGSLWKNNTPLPKGQPVKAAVSTLNLLVLAGVGILLVLLDFWLPREQVRLRIILAVAAVLVALSCLASLAWTSVEELRHPPKVPVAQRENPRPGGPPAGFGPGGPPDR